MELKDIVCDFEHAEKIRKLGVKLKGIFAYGDSSEVLGLSNTWPFDDDIPYTFTVSELGEMLPKKIKQRNTYYLEVDYCVEDGHWSVNYWNGQHDLRCYSFYDKKLSNAMASSIWELIENNHVNVKELNNDN